jgi:type VI protein secretion system component VasF
MTPILLTLFVVIVGCVVVAALVSAFRGLAQRLDEDISW